VVKFLFCKQNTVVRFHFSALFVSKTIFTLRRKHLTIYNGIKEVDLTEEELANFYSGSLKVDALRNQYVLLKLNGEVVDKYRYDGSKFIKVKPKDIESQILGKIKSRNRGQDLIFDLLNTDIPLLSVSGQAGSGKTFTTTAHALQEVQRGKYERIVIIRNDSGISGVNPLGILPGDATQKLRESVAYIGDIISDFMFDNMLMSNKISIAYLGTMRSRSISNAYILCNESQNLSVELVQMIVSRVGDGSRLIFDFDCTQIDKKMFEKDNGMVALNESLKGNPLFGAVELYDVERSEVAKLARLIH
jgi:PhoH-like ATPase